MKLVVLILFKDLFPLLKQCSEMVARLQWGWLLVKLRLLNPVPQYSQLFTAKGLPGTTMALINEDVISDHNWVDIKCISFTF